MCPLGGPGGVEQGDAAEKGNGDFATFFLLRQLGAEQTET